MKRIRSGRILPGFGLSMGVTLTMLTLIVLIPLATIVLETSSTSGAKLWATISSDRAMDSYWITFKSAAQAALANVLFGVIVAWVLVRYPFPGRGAVDAIIDLPFALPTAVAGIALTALYSKKGWLGSHLEPAGYKVAFAQPGIVMALTFITFPFVVRTVQPVLAELEAEMEESAATLGAGRLQIFFRIILPQLVPSMLTGFTLAFARGIGEYGSIVFISGNMPHRTEITSLLIMSKLEQYDYAGATALALVMLVASFLLLFAVNRLERWSRQRTGARA